MEDKMKCPICGKENRHVYFDESLGRIEEYYSCDNCGYNLEMCYSPIHEWIDLDKWNINKLKELWNSQSITTAPKENMFKMNKCNHYYIDDAGQGFTVPCCALSGSIEQNRSILYCDDCMHMTSVECCGDFDKCDIIKEVKENY